MTKTRNQLNLYAALDIVRGARRQLEVGECFYNPAWQKLCRIEWGLEEQIRAVA
jgi:hypothetical protein